MSWYDADYQQRAAITFRVLDTDNPVDIDIVIPPDWDEFWTQIDEDGYGLRVTDASGLTLLNYDVDDGSGGAFDKAGRLGRIRIDGRATAAIAGAIYLLWVFFDTETPTDGTVAVTITDALEGYIDLGSPAWVDLALLPQRPDTEEPLDTLAMSGIDEVHFWVNLTPFLELSRTPHAGRDIYEEPARVVLAAVDAAEADASAIFNAGNTRFVEIADAAGQGRSVYLRIGVAGGDPGTNYTLRPILQTEYPPAANLGRTQQISIGLQMFDVIEPAP